MLTDWPGYFANGPQIARVLLAAGADPNARDPEPGSESPLHWAASSDDADVARALIDGGADVNMPGGPIGAPLARLYLGTAPYGEHDQRCVKPRATWGPSVAASEHGRQSSSVSGGVLAAQRSCNAEQARC